jgi:hypothetical protein
MFNFHPFNRSLYNLKGGQAYRFHPILEAEYFEDSPQVNRAFVVGIDLDGATVIGNSAASSETALVGERLDVRHAAAVATVAAAGYAATAVLAKARLDGRSAKITIHPHCGLELWDVVSIIDIPANQSMPYRVNGYVLELDFKQAVYRHQCKLEVV